MQFPSASAVGSWPVFETKNSLPPDAANHSTTSDRLVEQVAADNEVNVDLAARLVRNVAIAGTVSRNGYRYDVEALKRAVPLYTGRPVFLDHSKDPEHPQSRSTRDLVGTLESVRFSRPDRAPKEGTIRGDIRVLDTESGRTFLALCESNEPGVGMSHVVVARRSEDGSIVESIEKVVSVDAVMFPATTSRLSEQESVDDREGTPRPDVDEQHAEVDSDSDCEQCRGRLVDLEIERARLLSMNERLVEEARTADREKMLLESGLPGSAVSVVFRDAVLTASDEVAAKRLIADRVALVHETLSSGPVSDPRMSVDDRADRFAETIRGRR